MGPVWTGRNPESGFFLPSPPGGGHRGSWGAIGRIRSLAQGCGLPSSLCSVFSVLTSAGENTPVSDSWHSGSDKRLRGAGLCWGWCLCTVFRE